MAENINSKQLMIASAIIDILRLFADNEIGGQYDINFDKVTDYIDSIRCVSDYFEYNTKEDVYNRFTEDIYNGFPVWRFLVLPEWTANMIEKSFTEECQNEYEQLTKTYKCLSCKHYEERKTMLGILPKCTFKIHDGHYVPNSRKPFNLKKSCKNYMKGEPTRV